MQFTKKKEKKKHETGKAIGKRHKLNKSFSVNMKQVTVKALINTDRELKLKMITDAVVKRDFTGKCGESGLFKGSSVITNRRVSLVIS